VEQAMAMRGAIFAFHRVNPVQMTAAMGLDTQRQFGKNPILIDQCLNVIENKGSRWKASNEAGMFMKIKAVALLTGNVAENTSG